MTTSVKRARQQVRLSRALGLALTPKAVTAASAKAESMVQRTEVVKQAEQRAKRLVEAAEDEARRLRHECEDFCDQRLAQFEIVLERTMKMVHAGREKLNATPMTAPEAVGEAGAAADEPVSDAPPVPPGGFGRPQSDPAPAVEAQGGFFDQDDA